MVIFYSTSPSRRRVSPLLTQERQDAYFLFDLSVTPARATSPDAGEARWYFLFDLSVTPARATSPDAGEAR